MADYRFYLDRVLTKKNAGDTLLLDVYPTTGFAYTYARNIISGQGNIIEAIKPDNSTSLFSSIDINDSALEVFANGGDVKIIKWFSLQGNLYSELYRNGNYQTTQPDLVISGNILKGVNNLPTINFSPSNSILESDLQSNNFGNSNFTWYLVYQSQPLGSRNIIISESVPTINFNGNQILSSNQGNELYTYRPQSTSFGSLRTLTSYQNNRIEHICIRRTGNLFEVFINKVKENEVTSTQLFTENTKLYVGTRAVYPNSTFNGSIFETVMYRESHSELTMNNIIDNQMDYYL